jgi:hypothetical protein
MKKIQLLIALAGLVTSQAAYAQSNPSKVYSSTGEGCTTTDGKTICSKARWMDRDSTLMKRAVLGVEIQTTGTKRDTLGVFISRVTPGGPAENAGIVEGERIAAVNGVDLKVAAADVDDSYTAGIASHRLVRELQKLTPGTRVSLRVYSGGRFRDVQVTTARASDLQKSWGDVGMVFPRMPNMPVIPKLEFLRQMEGAKQIMLHAPMAPSTMPARLMVHTIRTSI